jgi:hypothetical protein
MKYPMTDTRRLAEIIAEHGGLIQTGPFGSQLHQSDYTEGGVPVVMPKDIRDGKVDETTVAKISEEKPVSFPGMFCPMDRSFFHDAEKLGNVLL